MLQKQGRRGLAVGTGNADEGHAPAGLTKPVGSDESKRQTVVLHQNIGNIHLRLLGGNDNHRALGQRHRDKPVSVGSKACNGHKHSAGLDIPGIIGHILNVYGEIRMDLQHLYPLQQLLKFHSDSSLVCFCICKFYFDGSTFANLGARSNALRLGFYIGGNVRIAQYQHI